MLEGGKSLCQTHIISAHKDMQYAFLHIISCAHEAQDYSTCTDYTPGTKICKHDHLDALDFYPNLGRISLDSGISDTSDTCVEQVPHGKSFEIRDVYRLYQHQSIISYRPAIGFLDLRVGSFTKNPTLEGAVSKRKSTSQQKKVSKIMLKTIRVVSSIPAITMFCLVFYLDWISI